MSSEAVLQQIAQEVATCTKCGLCKGRNRTVPGMGNPEAKVMFIGEAPGYHEDQQGLPFVGPSGKLLDKLLNAIKLTRNDVFIGNVVKCRPPNNRDPLPDEIAACKNYLDRQIAAINPRVIVTLGRFSMARWFPGELISRIHGKPKEENGRIIMPMFHPAAALRDQVRTLQMFKEDGLTIPRLVARAEEMALTELWGQVQVEPEPVEIKAAPPAPKVDKPARAKAAPVVAEQTETYQPVSPVPVEEVESTPVVTAESEQASEMAAQNGETAKATRTRKKKENGQLGEQLTMF